MDQAKEIVIPVKLDEKTFKKFARFDMFILRKKWVRPVVFSLIMLGFAAVALLVRKGNLFHFFKFCYLFIIIFICT